MNKVQYLGGLRVIEDRPQVWGWWCPVCHQGITRPLEHWRAHHEEVETTPEDNGPDWTPAVTTTLYSPEREPRWTASVRYGKRTWEGPRCLDEHYALCALVLMLANEAHDVTY